MNFIDALAEFLFEPSKEERRKTPTKKEGRNGFSRGNVTYRDRRIQTTEQLEAERLAFKKSLARTDY